MTASPNSLRLLTRALAAGVLGLTWVGCGKILGVDAYEVSSVKDGSSPVSEGSPAEGSTPEPKRCALNSDCPSLFVCISGLCHVECVDSRDCQQNQRCVKAAIGDGGSVGSV